MIDTFRALETQTGLRRKGDEPLIFESETHRVSVELMDRHSTVACNVELKALPQSSVDAYSVIAYYHAQSLDSFLRSVQKRTDEAIAAFIAGEIAGPCAAVFQIVESTAWMRLHQFHLQSLRRRNAAFWGRVSGFDENGDLSEQAAF